MNMAIVRVFGNTYLNPEQVGKLTQTISAEDSTRTYITEVFDLTGVNLLLRAKTEVSTEPSTTDPHQVKRDNFFHEQIVAAINSRADAKKWEEPKSA